MEILYKKDSKGKIVQWKAETTKQAGVHIKITYGELDGAQTINWRRDIQGKNQGKLNQTSPEQQAEQEVKSLYTKKRKEGYRGLSDFNVPMDDAFGIFNLHSFLVAHLKFDTRDANDNVKPMLAQQYFKSKKEWKDPKGNIHDDRKYYYLQNPYEVKEKGAIVAKFPCLIQPKINGNRSTISLNDAGNIQIITRDGEFVNLPHIEDVLKEFKSLFNLTLETGEIVKVILDGELYIPGEKLQHINSAIKKHNLNTPRVEYHVFDLAIPLLTNLERVQTMKQLLMFTTQRLNCPIKIVPTYRVINDAHVQNMCDKFITDGHEGAIIRDPNALYMFGKRPSCMSKLKRTTKAEFEIIDIVPQDKNPNLGLFVCRTEKGEEFKVTARGSEEYKEVILFTKNKYIGKKLLCTFYELTDGKEIPFHIMDNKVIE